MLLRRFNQHVKAENWFAVLVDFLIVVLGVFVGLQVQDWNDARKEGIEKQELLAPLYIETQGLLDVQREELASMSARAETLTGVNSVLFSQEPSRALSPLECRLVAGSHVYRRPPDEYQYLMRC